MEKIRIGWMFPDILFLHGERGNLMALDHVSTWFSVQAEIVKIDFTNIDEIDFNDFDIILAGPGELSSIVMLSERLKPYKEKISDFIDSGKVLIVTGTSIAIFGNEIKRTDNTRSKGLGIIDVVTTEKDQVYGDDVYFTTVWGDEIIGNQIQVADFTSESEKSFGKIIYGYGNTGKSKEEGFIKNNSIFTNTLGPMLTTNMEFTKELIKKATGLKVVSINEEMMGIEKMSFQAKKEFILSKETKLNN